MGSGALNLGLGGLWMENGYKLKNLAQLAFCMMTLSSTQTQTELVTKNPISGTT